MSEVKVKRQKSRALLILALILLVGLTITGWQVLNRQYQPVDPNDQTPIDVVIPEQSTARQVAAVLKDNQLIHNETAFLTYCRRHQLDNLLQAGHYRLNRSQPLKDIALTIAEGRVVSISFTIPEGYTVEQIGQLLAEKNICTFEEWNQALAQKQKYEFEFLNDNPQVEQYLEGFLFPDTYYITEDIEAGDIINAMLNKFNQVWEENFASRVREKGDNVYEIITIASMVEREAMVAEERETIAGVIKNRLQKGMPLQIDATVLYALKKHKDIVTYKDLEVDSLYNTYKYSGLPPGPIACPGKAAIEAALNPAQHAYYYYVSRGDGSHQFSRTYSEHLQAKNKYIN